ncbi:MAG: hypothetical protein ACWA5R_00310, partial [bacterium]
ASLRRRSQQFYFILDQTIFNQRFLKKVSNLQQRIEQNEVKTRQTIQHHGKHSDFYYLQFQQKNTQFKQQTQAKIDKLNAEITALSESEN